ncbi:MAG: DUF3524 domain-containing protein [Proteobacteria bacterium]|nr:DUF3524 domain-containing protein [Pseudomonadota bacterium]MBU1687161.1 DUF3524 domain-containing protein [Pseudomonadota bacterium]
MKILTLEPYYGGSHRQFLDGLMRYVPAEFELLTLPARKWKWRMRLAAPLFAEMLANEEPREFQVILCSTFVDVATFKALAPPWLRQVPIFTYFHENQFVYPVQVEDERDFHFALTNVTTALASDRLAFNSRYNLQTLLAGARQFLEHAPDMRFKGWEERIQAKSTILSPGLDFEQLDAVTIGRDNGPPVILWNHRWEHDKDPETFFAALYQLADEDIPFRLIVCGQAFQWRPEIFAEAEKKLARRISHFGFVESRQEYLHLLKRADIVVSTARHEFFGLSVIEAVRAGATPLLPNSLSYPELFPEEHLYEDGDLYSRLKILLQRPQRIAAARTRELTDRFSWPELAGGYSEWLGINK